MNRDERQTLTQAILRRVFASPNIPSLRMGEIADVGSTPTVILDGESDARQANQLGDQAGAGERVWCLLWKSVCLVLGRAGGARLLGSATATVDQAGISTATDLTDLEIDVVVTQPGRELHIWGQIQASATTSAGDVIGRIQQDGVTIGRFGRFRALSINQPQLMVGMARVQDLSPGGYTFNLNLECQTVGTVTASNATTPGYIWVEDAGAVL